MKSPTKPLAPQTYSPTSVTPSVQSTALQNMLFELRSRKRAPGGMMLTNISSALEALWANRTRSLLTALGIFIGVAAVIAALTLTQGATESINGVFAQFGNTTIFVEPGSGNGPPRRGQQNTRELTVQDAEGLKSVPHVIGVSPLVVVNAPIIYGNQDLQTSVRGVSPVVKDIESWEMAEGVWFSDADDASGRPVAVIGKTIADQLFYDVGATPIGKNIRVRDGIFKVVGVLQAKGSALGQDQDSIVFVPFKAAMARLKTTNSLDLIYVQVDDTANVSQAQEGVTATLDRAHGVRDGQQRNFAVSSFEQIVEQTQQATSLLAALIIGVAAISLTVGGIGIMNIMLVSVTERTREIGLRMSIGARPSDIRNQFLSEALILCLIGGIVGMGLGLLIGAGVVSLLDVPFVVTPTTVIMPFIVSTAIALLFGLYPAVRASRLDPIVALRRR